MRESFASKSMFEDELKNLQVCTYSINFGKCSFVSDTMFFTDMYYCVYSAIYFLNEETHVVYCYVFYI